MSQQDPSTDVIDPYCKFNRDRHAQLVRRALRAKVIKAQNATEPAVRLHNDIAELTRLRDIFEQVCPGVWPEIVSKRQNLDIIPARQAFIYLAKERTPAWFKSIGRVLGNRHHTTILHSYREAKACVDGIDEKRQWKADAIRSIVSAVEARLK